MRSADFAPITSPIMTSGTAPKKRAHGGPASQRGAPRDARKHPLALTIVMPAPLAPSAPPPLPAAHPAAIGALMQALILHHLAVRHAHAIGVHQGALAHAAATGRR